MTQIFIATDSFKGTASSREVADALRRGLTDNNSAVSVDSVSMADGGEGTLDAFHFAYPEAVRHPVDVVGPTSQPHTSSWLQIGEDTAVAELADASGIMLANPLNALASHSYGFGQVLRAAIDAGMRTIYVGIGGSASTDGGMGFLEALGVRFYDDEGNLLSVLTHHSGNAALHRIVSADFSSLQSPLQQNFSSHFDNTVSSETESLQIRVISDVTNPLLGKDGAAAVFGPQKGASAEDIPSMDAALAQFASVISARVKGLDPHTPGAGAAGGCGFALLALGAELLPGPQTVSAALHLSERLQTADFVITGEGRFDTQSQFGKVPHTVAAVASKHQIPTILVAGRIDAATDQFWDAYSLSELAGSDSAAMSDTVHWLTEVGKLIQHRLHGTSD